MRSVAIKVIHDIRIAAQSPESTRLSSLFLSMIYWWAISSGQWFDVFACPGR